MYHVRLPCAGQPGAGEGTAGTGSAAQHTEYRGARPHRWPVAVDVDPRQGGRGFATGPLGPWPGSLGESLPVLVPLASQCTPPSHSSASTPLAIAIPIATSTQPSLPRGIRSDSACGMAVVALLQEDEEAGRGRGTEGSSNFTWRRPVIASRLDAGSGLSALPRHCVYFLP
jgi:hypothetical protein